MTNFAFGSDLELLRQLTNERCKQSTKAFSKRQVRTKSFVGFGSRHVHSEWHEVSGKCQLHHVGNRVASFILGFASTRTEVWCHNDVVKSEQRAIGARLNIKHVESSTSDLTRGNCFSKCGLINDATARNVDHAQVGLGLGQNFATDDAFSFFGLGQVHRNEITLRDDIIEAHHFNIHLTRTFFRDKWVVRNEAHTKRQCALRNQLANATKADDSEGLVGEFNAFPLAAFPTTCLKCGVSLGYVARASHEQSHGVLGC